MSTTPNLAIAHILPSQAQKEVTANAAFNALDQAQAGLLVLNLSAGGPIIAEPAAALSCKLLRLTGTLTAAAELVLPANRKPYFVHNATTGGFAVTVRTAAGSGVAIDSGADNTRIVYCDGSEILAIGASPSAATGPYDLGLYLPGQPEAGAVLLQYVAPRSFTLPAGLTGSQGYAGTAATAQADLDLQRNGASIGTITFAAASSTASFSLASETAFVAGDRVLVVAPPSQDPTLAELSITFKGMRT